MFANLRPDLALLAFLSLVTGVAYPFSITSVAQALFPDQANGSLIVRHGQELGSALIGQAFDDPRYFWSRPSATSPAYDARASTGSNLGPLNPVLLAAVKARVEALRAAEPGNAAPVPVDLVTASGSGLDPHISPAAALYQVSRVATHRDLPMARVRELVQAQIKSRALGLIGEPVVNVLELNLALDQLR